MSEYLIIPKAFIEKGLYNCLKIFFIFLFSKPIMILSGYMKSLIALPSFKNSGLLAISNVILEIDNILYQLQLKEIPEIGNQVWGVLVELGSETKKNYL